MNKLFTKIATFAIGAFMAVGVGVAATLSGSEPIVAHAATGETVYKTALFGSSYNSASISSYTSTFSSTNDGFTVTLSNFNNNSNGWNYVKCGRKNNASIAKIQTQDQIDKPISSVTVTIDAITATKVNSITLKTSADASKWADVGEYSKATGDQTVSISSPTSNLYYLLEFDCASGSSNGLITVSKVTYNYIAESGGDTGNDSSESEDIGGDSESNPTTGDDVSVTMETFDATSDDMDAVISYTTAQGGGTSAPAINSGEIRLYQGSATTAGGTITISAKTGYKITEVVIGSSMATSVAHTFDNEATKSATTPLAANGKHTIDANNSSVTVYCMGTSKTARLYVNYLKVTYISESESIATLSSIEVSGSLTKTTYTTADSWDPAGLTVTGIYSDGTKETREDVTDDATFKYYDANDVEKATPKDLGVGENLTLKVKATYNEKTSTNYVESNAIVITQAIEFTLVTDPSVLTKGTQFILVANGSNGPVAMLQNETTADAYAPTTNVVLSDEFNEGSIASSGTATVFTLDGVSGKWAIKNGENQLGFTDKEDAKNMQFNSDMTDTFIISNGKEEGSLSFQSNAYPGRFLQYNNQSPRFANYSGTQKDLYMFAIIAEVTYGTTDHIKISALPETEFCVGEAFHTTGMSLIAYDAADEETANSKIVDTYSTSIGVGTVFAESDIGEKEITVTYVEGSNFTTTYTIYVYASATYQLVTSEPTDGWAGTYIIAGTISGSSDYADGEYAFNSSLENLDTVGNIRPISPTTEGEITTVVASQHYQVTIAPMAGGDGYSIKAMNDKYIGWNTDKSNGINSYDEPFRNVISYNVETNKTLIKADTWEKGLSLDSSQGRFRYYSNPGVNLYKLTYSTDVQNYADVFLETLSTDTDAVCDANGNTDLTLLRNSWGILAEFFQELSNTNKEVFTQGTANESGDIIARTLALYDYIATKYGTQLESEACPNFDFMSRGITQEQSSNRIILANNSQNSISLIVIAAVVMSGLIIGYFALKKRKEQ